jgi:hypothetical protein
LLVINHGSLKELTIAAVTRPNEFTVKAQRYEENTMRKFVCLLLMLLMTSGCCELFGVCTSVNVHTRASSPPDKLASTGLQGGHDPSAWGAQTTVISALEPASAVASDLRMKSNFPACG